MICYTNHALDQFLSNCVDECNLREGVVRVGGRSKAEHLSPYFLSNLKQTFRFSSDLYHQLKDTKSKLADLMKKIEDHSFLIQTDGILTMAKIKHYIDDNVENFFKYESDLSDSNENLKKGDFALLRWLGFLPDNNVSFRENTVLRQNSSFWSSEITTNLANMFDQDNLQPDISNNKFEALKLDYDDDDATNEARMLDQDGFQLKFKKESKTLAQKNDEEKIQRQHELIRDTFIGLDQMYDTYMCLQINHRLNIKDTDEWQIAGQKKQKENKKARRFIKNYLSYVLARCNANKIHDTQHQLMSKDAWQLTHEERLCLYAQWCQKFKRIKTGKNKCYPRKNKFLLANLDISQIKMLQSLK